MSTISEKNIIDVDDSKIQTGTPAIQVLLSDRTLTIPVTPSSAFEVVGEAGNIINIDEISVKPNTPVILVDGMAYPVLTVPVQPNPGKLYVWGGNEYGQLGLGDTVDRETLTELIGYEWSNIEAVSNGTIAARAANGDVYVWGINRYGVVEGNQLLTPTKLLPDSMQENSDLPITIPVIALDKYCAMISLQFGTDKGSGGYYAPEYLLGTDGNYNGSMGNDVGFGNFKEYPNHDSHIGSLDVYNVKEIVAANLHKFVIDSKYSNMDHRLHTTLCAMGDNRYEQLGLAKYPAGHDEYSFFAEVTGFTNEVDHFVGTIGSIPGEDDIINAHYRYVFADTTGNCWYLTSKPVSLGKSFKYLHIAGAYDNTFAIDSDGVLYGWGLNARGELAFGHSNKMADMQILPITAKIKKVMSKASGNVIYAIDVEGYMWQWGDNYDTETGLYATPRVDYAKKWADMCAIHDNLFALDTDGYLYVHGILNNNKGFKRLSNARFSTIQASEKSLYALTK
jgi:hypothetical protein